MDEPYISIHLRSGPDWETACELLLKENDMKQLFSSNQCSGYASPSRPLKNRLEHGTCLPSRDNVIERLREALRDVELMLNTNIKFVHIATDHDQPKLWDQLARSFANITFVKEKQNSEPELMVALVDLFLMAHADGFVGNCVSSYSAFAARMRTEQLDRKRLTFYFGQKFTSELNEETSPHDEL